MRVVQSIYGHHMYLQAYATASDAFPYNVPATPVPDATTTMSCAWGSSGSIGNLQLLDCTILPRRAGASISTVRSWFKPRVRGIGGMIGAVMMRP